MRLTQYLDSDYIAAANVLQGGRQRIVAFVESYDDIAFWSQILRQQETDNRFFEVMLPSQSSLAKGKQKALSHQLGPCMIACVDADYDWLLQGETQHSRDFYASPYRLHTYAYAIENLQCYARGLHEVCVKATLNDAHIFPFQDFFRSYSEVIWPVFVWSVWSYRYGKSRHFSLSDAADIMIPAHIDTRHPEKTLELLSLRVERALKRLEEHFPEAQATLPSLRQSLLDLGLTPATTYLYMRGHDLMNGLVLPLLDDVCTRLRRQRERDIEALAIHHRQRMDEIAAYRHACCPIQDVIRKYTGYASSDLYQRILADAARLFPVG